MNKTEQFLRKALSGGENHQTVFLAALASWLTVVARAQSSEPSEASKVVQSLKECNELSNRVVSELYARVNGNPSGRSTEAVVATVLELIEKSSLAKDFAWAVQQATIATESGFARKR